MQWSHFVPGYDKWFDGTFTKEWGAKNNTNVVVDHVTTAEIPARAAAEVAAKRGHDLFMFVSPPAAYEQPSRWQAGGLAVIGNLPVGPR